MTFDAQMRIGSLEIVTALFAVAFLATRPRLRTRDEVLRLDPPQMTLRVVAAGGEEYYDGKPPIVIGRSSHCDVVVPDGEVSRRHALLEFVRGIVYLRDLESSNGTFLNGRAVRDAIEIRRGDEIDVGSTRLVVEEMR